ncbi:HD domain-containing phosphohydrolase [Amycolatopsis tolypomycina]|uniref:HD domain-containing protein n=1 Tax=Amycolatopsis tolypomycina TaxID=208445 RepID=A0A1H5C4S1_9PSEU|nr:HD domain-containing phosphohydrolase [Amycolatopsis tolypomycina]SED61527.1 HD domain-containing protein [Amycolatopsis tolypomycina]
MEFADRDAGIGLAELLAAFSLATDLGLGQPMEHVLRSWRIADRLAVHTGLPAEQRQALFPVSMLAWVGCVADSPEVAGTFGDDIAFRADSYDVDLAGLAGFGFFLGHAGRGGPAWHRLRVVTTILRTGGHRIVRGMQSHCLTTSTLAERLGLGPDVVTALRQFFTRWDGRGVPPGVGGTDIAPVVRLLHLADVVEVRHRLGGIDGAREVARARRGRQFAPDVVDAFLAHAPDVLSAAESDLVAADRHPLTEGELDTALEALADFTDLRCGSRAGHSRGVAELAGAAARKLGLPAVDVVATRRAGLLHDVGLHGVPVPVLDRPGPLSPTDWERVRLSSYYTERVLARPAALARPGAIAALAHERMDGSGYHRGLAGAALPMTGRVLAAACAYRAMLEPRAHRAALTDKQATAAVRAEARAGKLDGDAAEAVLAAAGNGGRRRVSGPAGLTPREVEVLILISRGAQTGEVAERLGISRRTAGTHIERIYTKTGASSRATATLFALRNGLLDPLDL